MAGKRPELLSWKGFEEGFQMWFSVSSRGRRHRAVKILFGFWYMVSISGISVVGEPQGCLEGADGALRFQENVDF